MTISKEMLDWLLDSDISLQYLIHKNLLKTDEKTLKLMQDEIPKSGWGKQFMDARNEDGTWGNRYYNPKWACTHYVLFDLKLMGFPKYDDISEVIKKTMKESRCEDGGINISTAIRPSDTCVNGMVLNFGSYFLGKSDQFNSIIDYFVDMQMSDGGFNCNKTTIGAKHSSVHTTLSVLEGLLEYKKAGNTYRIREVERLERESLEFLLLHHLYRSHQTNEIMHPDMTRFTYPYRYWFDVLRMLEYLVDANIAYDKRMDEAIDLLMKKRLKNGRWKNNGIKHGKVFLEMEKTGSESKINTYRALRVIEYYGLDIE
jgi:hypothetical protein